MFNIEYPLGVGPYATPCSLVPPSPAAAPTLAYVGGWAIVGHCPKCGSPVWAKPRGVPPVSPASHYMSAICDDMPVTTRSCDCIF